jgi:hypothetical protein
MPPLAVGRKIKTFIGTIAEQRPRPKSVRRKFVKSRKPRQRHFPLHCMIRSFSMFVLRFLNGHHTAGLGRPRRNHHQQVHKGRVQTQSGSLLPRRRSVHMLIQMRRQGLRRRTNEDDTEQSEGRRKRQGNSKRPRARSSVVPTTADAAMILHLDR